MPSQNLPKPNPPQVTKVFSAADSQGVMTPNPIASNPAISNPTAASFAAPNVAPSSAAPSALPTRPMQPTQVRPQIVPAGLSQENPGGTPPNMRVAAGQPAIPALDKTEPVVVKAPETNTASINLQTAAKPASTAATAAAQSSSPANKTLGAAPIQMQVANRPTGPAGIQPTVPTSTTQTQTTPAIKPEIAAAASAAGAEPATKKKLSLPIIIAAAIVALLVIGGAVFALLGGGSAKPATTKPTTTISPSAAPNTTLTYWGLWEDSQILKEVIADFENKNPSIKIDYRKQSHRDYRERLQQANVSGNGPDIFRYHVAWVPMLTQDLATMPTSVMTANEYKQALYPTAFNNLQVGGQIVGIPLMYDGLALLYNKEMLKTANLEVPKTWAELRTAANKLTTPANPSERQSGNLIRAGLAIGNAGNVDHFSDILGLLIVQNGGNPAEANTQFVKDALTFYTNFFKQDKVWSERMANSTTAFAKGDVAMIFAPSWRIHDIQALNPSLEFGVAPVPQLDSEKPVAWATFWAEGVSSKSKNKDVAWSFLKYLSSPDVLRKFYNSASQYRSFGEIYPRVEMAGDLKDDALTASYLMDAPIAKSWYLSSFTHDNGINDQIIKYYEDAVNATLSSNSMDKTVETLNTGLKTVLAKYSF